MITGQSRFVNGEIKIGKYTVTLENDLGGVKYWAVGYKNITPRFEIFVYVGRDYNKELYFFKSRKDNNILIKSMKGITASIEEKSFYPFVIDFKKMTTNFGKE